jgi:hypothetical protein
VPFCSIKHQYFKGAVGAICAAINCYRIAEQLDQFGPGHVKGISPWRDRLK